MAEKRISGRRRVFKAGKIVFNQGGSVIDCTVRNISPTGAMVNVVNAIAVPQEFDLRWDGHAQHCSVIWRKVDGLGVWFDNCAELQAKPSISAASGRRSLRWTGEVPAQIWTNFHSRVLAKFAGVSGLRVTVNMEIAAEPGISEQEVEETRNALKELGLDNQLQPG